MNKRILEKIGYFIKQLSNTTLTLVKKNTLLLEKVSYGTLKTTEEAIAPVFVVLNTNHIDYLDENTCKKSLKVCKMNSV